MTLFILVALVIVPSFDLGSAKGEEIDRGIASLYRPWRKGPTVPYGRYAGKWRVKPTPRDLVCAHRTLPFGTILRLTPISRGVFSQRSAVCVVLDRGPYGFCERRHGSKRGRCPRHYKYTVTAHGREMIGHYRGVIDATPAVHKMMRTRGWVRVKVEKIHHDKLRHVLRVKPASGV